jgi:hypothetical protein
MIECFLFCVMGITQIVLESWTAFSISGTTSATSGCILIWELARSSGPDPENGYDYSIHLIAAIGSPA